MAEIPNKTITWACLKNFITSNHRYCYQTLDSGTSNERDYIFTIADQIEFGVTIVKDSGSDWTDWSTNYKSGASCGLHLVVTPLDQNSKPMIRSESRPPDCTTWFSTRFDKITATQKIGGGKRMEWDFSNSTDDITGAPSGFKRKQIEGQFIDTIWVKEGTIYFHNQPKGAYLNFSVVCPNGQYYYKNDGTLTQATADTVIYHYVVEHPLQGSAPMGDELNTEACSNGVPSNYKFRLEIDVPTSDSTSNGFVEIEVYRVRTVIL